MAAEYKLIDNSPAYLSELNTKVQVALDACAEQAVSHAKSIITRNKRVDTGMMRNSVAKGVVGETAYIGTNMPYAVYHELGTGIYASQGGGRRTPWTFVGRDGKRHWTRGVKPIHFIRDAIADHEAEYRQIIEQEMKK